MAPALRRRARPRTPNAGPGRAGPRCGLRRPAPPAHPDALFDVARVGGIDRSIGEPPCARRCRRTEARTGLACLRHASGWPDGEIGAREIAPNLETLLGHVRRDEGLSTPRGGSSSAEKDALDRQAVWLVAVGAAEMTRT